VQPLSGADNIISLIARYPWPQADAVRIARCEGGLALYPPDNGTSVGPFQINAPYHMAALSAEVGHTVTDLDEALRLLRIPALSVAVAYRIEQADGGFYAWSCN
jgi:hypothetical protein